MNAAELPSLCRLQICTVAISRRPGSTDAEGFPVSGSSSSGPERTASLVLPDSPVREAAVSGPAFRISRHRRFVRTSYVL